MIIGKQLMPMWPADSLDTLVLVSCKHIQKKQLVLEMTCSSSSYSVDAIAYSNAYFGQGTSLSIYLDDVACTTAQSRLIDCSYDSNTGDCSHSEDAGVQCVAREYFLIVSLNFMHS